MNKVFTANLSQPLSASSFPFQIVDKLGNSKASVYLVWSAQDKKHYAMKIFLYEEDQINQLYLNESRFCNLSHNNIISFSCAQNYQKAVEKGKEYICSFIVMEAAPYGDFSKLFRTTTLFRDEKLLRTYFRQLIDGIEYLHSKGIAHMDLKLDNLLMGEYYRLKISDFDTAYKKKDCHIVSRGTRNYRAPEVREEKCMDPQAADIYSAGIILFVLKTACFPYLEDTKVEGHDMYELMRREDPKFWDIHANIQRGSENFDPSFRKLFLSMVKEDVFERATIDEIKKSLWYQGSIYTQKELEAKFSEPLLRKLF